MIGLIYFTFSLLLFSEYFLGVKYGSFLLHNNHSKTYFRFWLLLWKDVKKTRRAKNRIARQVSKKHWFSRKLMLNLDWLEALPRTWVCATIWHRGKGSPNIYRLPGDELMAGRWGWWRDWKQVCLLGAGAKPPAKTHAHWQRQTHTHRPRHTQTEIVTI